MIKTILMGWFAITVHTTEGKQHNYLLTQPAKNVFVSLSTDEPLPYGENQWIKLKMKVECQQVSYDWHGNAIVVPQYSLICNAVDAEIMHCTESNSIRVNGVLFCGGKHVGGENGEISYRRVPILYGDMGA